MASGKRKRIASNTGDLNDGNHRMFSGLRPLCASRETTDKSGTLRSYQAASSVEQDLATTIDPSMEEGTGHIFLSTEACETLAQDDDDDPIPKSLARTRKALGFPKKRTPGLPVPKSLEDAGPADKMLWTMKLNGKPWAEINEKWEQITGRKPGSSSLSVRWLKICHKFADTGGLEDMLLAKCFNEAKEELEDTLWNLVAEKFNQETSNEHSPDKLKKRYKSSKNNGGTVT